MARILIMDDEEQIRLMLRMSLEHDGHQVKDAPDGKVGLELCQEEPFDLVITDIVMPGKDGIETIVELRRSFPKIKIIAMSGGGQKLKANNVLQTAGLLGAQCTLIKPFKLEELFKAIRDVLGSDN